MEGAETKAFNAFKKTCALDGSRLELSTWKFAKSFPDFGVYFNHYEAYLSVEPGEYISPSYIKAILDQGKVVVLNIQNVALKKKTLIPCDGGAGHNICCVSYDPVEDEFIFQDSNKYGNSCQKTMDAAELQVGYETLLGAGDDLEKRLACMKNATHVSEMYVADTEEHVVAAPTRRRRSSRRK